MQLKFDQFNIWTLSVEQENSAKREIHRLGHLYYLLQNKQTHSNKKKEISAGDQSFYFVP